MSTTELIKAIEALKTTTPTPYKFDAAHDNAIDKAIDLIHSHMANKVIVPVNWVEVARCPSDCDNGIIPHQTASGWEIEQCQFCYEKGQMLSTQEGE